MNKHAFIVLLAVLDKKELSSFKKYLNFRYRKDSLIFLLFEYIIRFYPDFDGNVTQLSKDQIEQKVFTQKKLHTKRLSNLFSQLKGDLKSFLLLQNYQSGGNDFLYDTIFQEIYAKKGLVAKQTKERKKIMATLENQKSQDWQYHLNSFSVHYQDYFSYNSPKYKSKKTSIAIYDQSVQQFFLCIQLLTSIEKLFRNLFHKENHPINFDYLTLVYQQIRKKNNLLAQWLYQMLCFLYQPKQEEFISLTKQFFFIQSLVEHRTASTILGFLFNAASLEIRKGKKAYNYLLFKLYYSLFEKEGRQNLLINNGLMSIILFNNISSLACVFEEQDWAENFIEKYKKHLPSRQRLAATLLAKAEVYYSRQDYQTAKNFLYEIKKTDFTFQMRIYCLELLCEHHSQNVTENLEQNYYAFLRNNREVSVINKEAGNNFIHIIRDLNNKNPDNKNWKTDTIEKLAQMTNVFYRSWLEKAIKEH